MNDWETLLTLDARFAAKVGSTESCWLWIGAIGSQGYGNMRRGRYLNAHRYAFELLRGPVPAGLVLDHLCQVRNCVNPAHLEPVKQAENLRRAPACVSTLHARQTECAAGHPFTEENTYHWRGHRRCRTCNTEAKRQERDRQAGVR